MFETKYILYGFEKPRINEKECMMSALNENEFSISKFPWTVSSENAKDKIIYDFGINKIHLEFEKFIV